jgi:hypothetical protein
LNLSKTNSILTNSNTENSNDNRFDSYSSDTLALSWDYEKDSSNQSNFSLNIVNYPSKYKKYNLIESIKNNNFNKNDVNLSINFKEMSEQISLKVKNYFKSNFKRKISLNAVRSTNYGIYLQFYCEKFFVRKSENPKICKKLYVAKYLTKYDCINLFEDSSLCDHYDI